MESCAKLIRHYREITLYADLVKGTTLFERDESRDKHAIYIIRLINGTTMELDRHVQYGNLRHLRDTAYKIVSWVSGREIVRRKKSVYACMCLFGETELS